MLSNPTFSRRGLVFCASLLALSLPLPALAQLGQSDWVHPGDSDSGSGQTPTSLAPQSGSTDQSVNPGRGWMPAHHSLPMQQEAPIMAPVQQQQQMMPVQGAQMEPGGPQLNADGSMPWQDLQRRQPVQQMQQPAPSASAFQGTPQGGQQSGGDPWHLPSAQQQMDLQWAQNLPSVPMSAVMPTPNQQQPKPAAKPAAKPATTAAKPAAKTATKTAAKPGAKPAAGKTTTVVKANPNKTPLSGQVSQSANANQPQPTTQFDPNSGTAVQGPYGTTGMMGGAQPMQQGMMPMQGMQPMQQGMMPMQPMQQGMMPMQPMQQGMMPMQGMQPMGAMQQGGMQSNYGGAVNPQNAMQALMGGAAGQSGDPMDAIGKAIAGAAASGMIPSSQNSDYGANNAQYGQAPSGMYQQGSGGGGGGGYPQQRPQQRQQQGGNGMGSNMTRNMTNNINRSLGTALNMGLSRLHW